jgi:Trk-type K+ transport system membrane component
VACSWHSRQSFVIAGAVAFFVYASLVNWLMTHYKWKAFAVTTSSTIVWLGTALGFWYLCLR